VARRGAIALLTGTSVAVLFAAVATAGEVRYAARGPSFGSGEPPELTAATTPPPTSADAGSPDYAPVHFPHFVEVFLRGVVLASIAVMTGYLLVYAWRHRPHLQWRLSRRARRANFETLADVAGVAAALEADAEAQRAALASGSPRNAIVECWLRLEAAVADAGVRRNPADTSTELTVRVLTRVDVDQAAIQRLAALYREARFSEHPMGESARAAAIDALDAIHHDLRAHDVAVGASA
jgi:hypothetical protein